MDTRRENHRYDESGLPGLVLENVEVRHCPKCGNDVVVIPRMAQLHRTIALALLRKRERLAPTEIRFLRKSLGWSQQDFAKHLHVDPSTVSRWEREEKPQVMDISFDIALRLAVALGEQIGEYDIRELAGVAVDDPKPSRFLASSGRDGWTIEADAA
jgi:putative zinc finger/helix-turn-helix YgiT family protein